MSGTYDVIFVGGGIMGCCSAFTLAQRGKKVALFEKGSIGEGPTGYSSGILRTHYSNELTARMAKYGLDVYSDFEQQIGDQCGFHRTGFLMLVPPSERAQLERTVARHRELGIRSEIIGREAILSLMPGLWLEPEACAVFEPDSGYADAYLAVGAYARAARQKGVDVFQDSEVVDLGRPDRGNFLWVETAKGRFEAPYVVDTAGAWGARVSRHLGVELPIQPRRVQVAFFRRPSAQRSSHPIVADFSHASYCRPEGEDLTLVGLIDPSEGTVVDPDGYRRKVDFEFQANVGARLVERYPAMEESGSTGGYASLYAVTPDWHPIIDEVPKGSGFVVCAGFSGHGFKLAPAVGVIVADLVTGVTNPAFDPALFRLSRFDGGELVKGNYQYSIVG